MQIDHRTPPPARDTRRATLATTGIAVLVVAALAAGITVSGPAPAAPAAPLAGAGPGVPPATDTSSGSRLADLGDLVVDRLRLADPVARYKWLHGVPIADPAREQAVTDEVTAAAQRKGIDPARVVAVVRSQIDASKLVQRGLFTRWSHDPWSAPTTSPDIASLRQQITDIDDAMVDAVGAVADVADDPRCPHVVEAERRRVQGTLDSLTRKGLHLAWAGFCRR